MNKLTKLGIVTFSAVTLSAVVPTLVHAEENVAPQPNVAVKPNTAQPTPAPKPAENPQPEVKPAEQPQPTQPVKPAENKPVDNKPAETPVPTPKSAENPQPEVKPAEQLQPANLAKPEVKPAEQPQENNRKPVRRWPLRDGSVHEHPVVTYADIVAPLPISDMKETFSGIWTAEKDFINNKPRLAYFVGGTNRWLEENGREFSPEELRESHILMRAIRVKIPELEGRNYEAYTIYTAIWDEKTRKFELNKNTNITGQGYMIFRTKKEDNDVEVYQFSKNRQLTPLYHRYQLNERGRTVGEFGLYAEVYQTYVFLFKNPAEKPAEQVKPEVKPSEQPQPTKPVKPTPKPTPTQSGWSGSSYYQNGVKVTNKWIFDKKYNSFFYLNASGNYVQNAWVGNYYLKSGGYMAKSEWIYDKNYGSYYYLTSEGSYARNTWVGNYYLKSNGKMAKSEWIYDKNYGAYYYLTAEGSYARNTWVGDYYLKSNGKMAVNERTPDGYQVDGSGKWVR